MEKSKTKSQVMGFGQRRLPTRLSAVSWRDLVVVGLPVALVVAGAVWAAVTLVRPAPPDTICLLGGAEGSSYRTHAERYRKIIEGYGVKVRDPAVEGIAGQPAAAGRLRAGQRPAPDVGFVQSGLTDGGGHQGSGLAGQRVRPAADGVLPRQRAGGTAVASCKGKRLAMGPEGSGTRALALALLKANESDGPPTVLLPLGGEEAARALAGGERRRRLPDGRFGQPQGDARPARVTRDRDDELAPGGRVRAQVPLPDPADPARGGHRPGQEQPAAHATSWWGPRWSWWRARICTRPCPTC